ncbi:LysR family transcriptional regulator [Paucilactobacillus suebicus]|uniref:Transcriptional regulator n=1 Tax=Paucilactobacillus suebicus DSM 5007 = KCTC 3549 TaxID=1423807 RepID=A0A0R1W6K6_9LACO|nr:LysR family transcriptional regulator [Paucilactobacillus suebicus]KRM13122.1 transcriptional regulator [Paucilactobacillus suebicus DSM 5007 = KCTC 3549]
MEIRVLRYFVSVAQTHNMSEAARILHVSQPTLSRQIADLEVEVGGPLFERRSREMVLTATGRYLLSKANTILSLVDKTTTNLQAQQVDISGSLDIGSGESENLDALMKLLAHFQYDYPNVTIHLHTGNAMTTENQLENGLLDLGVTMGRRDLRSFDSLKLPQQNRWGVIMRKDSQLAQKSSVVPTDLINLPIFVSEQAMQRDFFADWWRNVKDSINVIGTYDLLYNSTLLVRARKCYAIAFDGLLSGNMAKDLTFRPLQPELNEPINIIWSKNQQLSPITALFLKRLRAAFG